MPEFKPFAKIPRLRRDCIITEKIDGTNAQIVIVAHDPVDDEAYTKVVAYNSDMTLRMYACSRTRYITPDDDNCGFAKWVRDNAEDLFQLGVGQWFGEWWGQKIQRGYGMTSKQFSLFHTHGIAAKPDCVGVVPVLYEGPFSDREVDRALDTLRIQGSFVAPFMDPEGIVVYHLASRQMFKVTLQNDAAPKGVVVDSEKSVA